MAGLKTRGGMVLFQYAPIEKDILTGNRYYQVVLHCEYCGFKVETLKMEDPLLIDNLKKRQCPPFSLDFGSCPNCKESSKRLPELQKADPFENEFSLNYTKKEETHGWIE